MADLEKPNKNIQLLLFILDRLGKVDGRIKLYKIHYLIEGEGHVKYDSPISNYKFGPVDYISVNFCIANGLLQEELCSAGPHSRYTIRLTPEGKRYFRNICEPLINDDERKKAEKIINKYKDKNATEILDFVHKTYVDTFRSKSKTLESIGRIESNLPIYRDLVGKNIGNGSSPEDEDRLYCMLGYLHHVGEILKKLKDVSDPVKRGQVICTIDELFGALKGNKCMADGYATELFEYLDNYCEKEGIFRSIADDDFSDIPKEARERLFKTIAQMEIPLSS
ncbi:MAG: hypothetical protein V1676_07245 [Candidatus Diapherotrites archaeon]